MGLLLATLIPAAAAASAVLVLTAPPWTPTGTTVLERLAERAPPPHSLEAAVALRPIADIGATTRLPPISGATARVLHPLLAREGRGGLEASPLEPLEGGVRPAPPQRLAIAAAGVDAVVERVSTSGGTLEVPDVGRAGWYEAGARPGEPGRAVVIGHLDRRQGPGLFARVPHLRTGSEITVTDLRGEVRRFSTVRVTQVPKDRFPNELVYGASRTPMLVLVTCGGPYRQGRGYRDNVVLFARAA
jgi:sortase family protein